MSDLALSVQYACQDVDLPTRAQLRRWVKAASKGAARVTVRFVGTAESRRLNRDYRGKDHATNVLSFVYDPGPPLAGDLVLCASLARREAARQKKAAKAHFAHLILHGMLHLQGYDHETSNADAERMEARERELLARFGYTDPYEIKRK